MLIYNKSLAPGWQIPPSDGWIAHGGIWTNATGVTLFMDFFYSTELAIPISQMILLLFSSTLALLFGRVRLALMINYLFTLYWGYLYQKDVLFEASLQSVLYLYTYFGFGILIAFIAIVGFLRSRDWAKPINDKGSNPLHERAFQCSAGKTLRSDWARRTYNRSCISVIISTW